MERQGSFEMSVTPRQKRARATPCPNTATIVAVLRNIPRGTQSSLWSWSHQSNHSHWYLGIVLQVIYLQKDLRTKESENVAA